MTPPARVHFAPREVAAGGGRLRALCGARALPELVTSSIAAASCERCREVFSSPHHAGEIADQLLAATDGDISEAWKRLALWLETGVLRGGPEPLRGLLAAVRVHLDRLAEPTPGAPRETPDPRPAHRYIHRLRRPARA